VDEFRTLGRTRVLRNSDAVLGMLPRKWKSSLSPHLKRWCLRGLLAGRQFDLIYANTAATWPLVRALQNNSPLVWHIHELSYTLRLVITDETGSELFRQATGIIAVSSAVRDVLVREYGVSDDVVDLVYGFVPCPDLSESDRSARRRRVREALGWGADTFVVGGCGTLGWRKGTDLFLQIARRTCLTEGRQEVRFLWVGGEAHGPDVLEFEHDLHALGLDGRCVRVPAVANMLDYYCAMDAFALTSREDPFPLVMLEAGALSLPVVCFAGSGGGPEFVGSGAGLIAPCQDVAAFTNHLLRLHDTPSLRHALGDGASTKVRTCYNLETQAPRLRRTVERCLHRARAAAGSGELRALAAPSQRRPQEHQLK